MGWVLHAFRIIICNVLDSRATLDLMNRWQQPGDVTDVPKMIYSTSRTTAGSYHNTRFLYDGDFIRLKRLNS